MPEDRLRPRPSERFASSELVYDLQQEFERLPEESRPRQGHMQKAIWKHGRLTCALFEFEPGGSIPAHSVEGEAVLHVISGHIAVNADGQEHVLGPGQVLLLDPRVPHDLSAEEPARVLMHVVLEESGGPLSGPPESVA